jgi:hypothetical protein
VRRFSGESLYKSHHRFGRDDDEVGIDLIFSSSMLQRVGKGIGITSTLP